MALEVFDIMKQANSGEFPIIDSNDILGGIYSVANTNERDSIPKSRRKEGMLCYVAATNQYYQLMNGVWEDAALGGIVVSETEPDNKNVLWVDPGSTPIHQEGPLSIIQSQIKTLQEQVSRLIKIIDYGVVAGDSSGGTRVSMMNRSEPINPNEDGEIEDEETEDDGLIEPISEGLFPTVPHLSIKMDTQKNFIDNKRNLIDGELVWITDQGRLYIFIDGTFKPVSSGVASDDNTTDDNMTQEDLESLYFNNLGFVDKNSNQYYIQINEEGNIIVYNSANYDGEKLGSSLTEGAEVGGSYISNYLRINSVFFGGINTPINSFQGATHNFIELANASDNDINLNGIYLLYHGASSGEFWEPLPLKGIIKAGSTFLIRGAKCSVKSNTNVAVDSYDLQWYTNENTLKAFDADGGTFYLVVSQQGKIYNPATTDYVEPDKFPGTINPYGNTIPIGYIDLVGVGSGKKSETNPVVPTVGSKITDCVFFRQYALDPGSGTVLKAWAKRTTDGFWTYCDMTKKYTEEKPYFTELLKQRLAPKSSSYHKNFFSNKQVFLETKPNAITLTLGKQGTVNQGNLATRCFNWVSVGYYDEFIEYKKNADSTWNKIYSFDGSNSEDPVLNTYKEVYKRFRWVSSNGTAVTTHKVILRNLSEGSYIYRIGRDGDSSYLSEERTFEIKTNAANFNFIHTTDQQGFNYNEYCAWIKAAKAIKDNETYDFIINTGDMTQSGNRESEWLDYCMGRDVLGGIPEMACIGNNDLCGKDIFKLGKGVAGTDKINSQSIWLFYTFELDVNNTTYFHFKYVDNGIGKLEESKIGNVLNHTSEKFEYFIPSVYSFDYGDYHFICLNSEFATNAKVYSIYYNDANIENIFKQSAYFQLYKWLEKDIELNPNKKYICFHHEIPFNIIKLNDEKPPKTIARTVSNGSQLNTDFSGGILYTDYTDDPNNYSGGCCFSEFFQNNNIKLVLGGHKHTYSMTYPTVENVTYTDGVRSVNYAQPFVKDSQDATNSTLNYNNAVVYCMSQATGYKLESNKDKPGSLQGSANTNWLYHFYPYGATLNPGQQFPMYSSINCSEGILTLKSYAVTGIYKHSTSVTPFNINSQETIGIAQLQVGEENLKNLECKIDYNNNIVTYSNELVINTSKSN